MGLKKTVRPKYYYFYLGEGNNHGLIRTIFKKRGWWMETNSMVNSNLVWTQLKLDKILAKI